MKKVLILLLISLIITTNVSAAENFSTEFTGFNQLDKEINLELKVNNLNGFSTENGGLCAISGVLNFDKSKLELVSLKPLSGFELVSGPTIVLFTDKGVENETAVFQVVFKNIGLKSGEMTTVTFDNVHASDGDSDFNGSIASKVLKNISTSSNNSSKPVNNNNTNSNLSSNSTTNTITEPYSENVTSNEEKATITENEIKSTSNNKSSANKMNTKEDHVESSLFLYIVLSVLAFTSISGIYIYKKAREIKKD